MSQTFEFQEVHWQLADAIAQQLVLDETDVNELRKVLSYGRAYGPTVGKSGFFDYLKTLAKAGDRIGHSKQTKGYYQSLERILNRAFQSFEGDMAEILQVLGWAVRLVFYYKDSPPVGEVVMPEMPSQRQLAVQAIQEQQSFKVGQELNAIVRNIKGNKVTYEVLGAISLTVKEPKSANLLSVGDAVIVRVEKLKDDNSLKNIKYLRSS